MDEMRVTVELHAPLLAGSPRPAASPQIQESAGYLPGAVLRGAVGTKLARICGHARHPALTSAGESMCDFQRIFLSSPPPRFGVCYPIGATGRQSYPFPATAYECKHYPGFQWDNEDAHGIQDILLRQWVIEKLAKQGSLHTDYPWHCDKCGAKLKAVHGFYEPHEDGSYRQPRAWLQRFSRVAMDRQRGVAADQLLYTLEVIAEEMDTGQRDQSWTRIPGLTRLAGRVWAAAEAALLKQQLEAISHLGGDTARGLGSVRISVDGPDPVAKTVPVERITALTSAIQGEADWNQAVGRKTESDLVARLALFNSALRRMYDTYGLAWPSDTLFFSVDLLSDTIWPRAGLASPLLPDRLAGAERVRAFTAAHVHSGWHTAARMMRRTELAIDAGGVFLYCLTHAGDQKRLQATLDALLALERDGAGRERERGYGWVQICAPFHLEVKAK